MALLPPPNNPANAFGVGSYLVTPRWFLGLPVVTTLTGMETVYSVQDGADVQIPLSLVPLIDAVEMVSLSMPSIFNVAGSPVVPQGSTGFTVTLVNEAQNSVFAGPSTGGPGTPGFRPLVAADLPTVPPAQGGTGQTSLTAHAVLLGEGAGAVAFAGPGAANTVLTGNGVTSDPSFQTFAALMLTWFNSLPITLPASSGVLWNNGGTLAQS